MGLSHIRTLSPDQRNTFIASFLGWTLDAFDFFILVFVIKDVAKEFGTDKTHVALALTLTLALRPVGAFIFGLAADRYGRRMVLMVDVILYSILELLSGFAPSLTSFLILRTLFGVAMGGEWGIGASLAMETIPAESRGFFSGVLQEGYVVGYILAAIVFPLVAPHWGWRAMFFIGALPALLSLFIRAKVKESPVWERRQQPAPVNMGAAVRANAGLFAYLVLLMTAFTFMSHGTQDIYPTFLQVQHHFEPGTVSTIAIIYNIGALIGGIFFGSLSQRIGRRKAIIIAALLALPMIPLWAFSKTAAMLALGAFLMQFMVQGAWGVIPAHLTELAPNALRGTFTGFAYQLGNLLSAINATLQTNLAEHHYHNDYGRAMASVVVIVFISVAVITALGREAKGVSFSEEIPDLKPA
ncbi:MAG: MFS transporter [Abitibacteriaceae bacterium]|nr:MFS transporter [Abditibacteriaceae bacterium]